MSVFLRSSWGEFFDPPAIQASGSGHPRKKRAAQKVQVSVVCSSLKFSAYSRKMFWPEKTWAKNTPTIVTLPPSHRAPPPANPTDPPPPKSQFRAEFRSFWVIFHRFSANFGQKRPKSTRDRLLYGELLNVSGRVAEGGLWLKVRSQTY